MEKYRQFAHQATGVNPFIPPGINAKLSLFYLRAVLLWPLFAIRLLVLFSVALPTLAVFDKLPVRSIRASLVSLMSLISLKLLGFSAQSSEPDYKKLRMMNQVKTGNPGHVIISQYQSPCDVLVLGWSVAPESFGFPASDGRIEALGIFWAFLQAGMSQPLTGTLSVSEFFESKKFSVLFPEGCRTNGTGVLSWDKSLREEISRYSIMSKLGTVAIAYNTDTPYSAHLAPGGNFMIWLWGLGLSLRHTVKISRLSASKVDDPRALFVRLCNSIRKEGSVDTDLSCVNGSEFAKYWNKTRVTKYL